VRDDLLSLLVAARDDGSGRLTDAELRDEAVTMLLAGHETTSNALAWTWLALAQHPDAADALAAEADAILGERPAGADDVERLQWCGQVLAEALRLYPPGWVLPRLAVEPVELGEFVVPAGAVVIVCAPLLHRDPRFWDDPERFDPSRFAPDAARDRPRDAYIPFAAGPRSCIGRGFAQMEATIILATLGRRFRAALVPGARLTPATRFTLRPRYGLPMTLASR
jgi:cytochrome P450